jgi:transcriptional regulator with PAS, ATPase and Fis domain
MTLSVAPPLPECSPAFTSRQRDRRVGIGDLLAIVWQGVEEGADAAALRRSFESMVRRLVPVRSATLRDGQGRSLRHEAAEGSEALALEVPGTDAVTRGIFEVRFDPPSGLADWDLQVLHQAAHVGALVLEIERARPQTRSAPGRRDRDGAKPLVGNTPAMQNLCATIDRVAATDFIVLLEGESGVGKELVARQIHAQSRRRSGPFVAINCAALVETLLEAELFGIEDRTATGVRGRRGKFEYADGGTLFLDEISDLSVSAQAKLLRTIQDFTVERVGGNGTHRVDIRIVAATNRSLKELVDRKLFRPDLYYRLSGVDVRVPPLRERRADILELARYFLERHRPAKPLQLSASAADALLAYDWPGNVRELERVIEGVVTMTPSGTIQLDDLPPAIGGPFAEAVAPALQERDTLRAFTSRYVRLTLDRCGGNKRAACRLLGISYHTLVAHLNYGSCAPANGDVTPVCPDDPGLVDSSRN